MEGKRRGKLLLVEDETLLRRLIAEYLRAEGFDVIEAADGLEGASLYSGHRPFDLVLLDLNLPYLSGVDVCRRIKALRPNQPVLICSAAILDGHVADLLELKVDQFLTKPYHPLDLLERIALELARAAPWRARPRSGARICGSDRGGEPTRSNAAVLPCSTRGRRDKMKSLLVGASPERRPVAPGELHRDSLGIISCAKDGLFMAGKPLNRLELRRQREAAEPLDPMEDETEDVVEETEEEEVVERRPKKKPKAPAKPKAKSSRSSSKPAARMRIVWAVLNDAFKPVATFEYNQKEAAETRAAELTAKGKGTHFVQRTKEPMPEDAPGIGAAIPRTVTTPTKAERKAAEAAVVEDEEEIDEEEETEIDMADEPEDEEE